MSKIYHPVRALLLSISILFTSLVHGQSATIHTSGGLILGVCGDTILIRGVNYAPYDWGYDSSQHRFDQIALTGANAVRIPWYASNPAPYYTDAMLDSALGQCIRHKMIPILELHDLSCDPNTADLDTLVTWYITPARLAIITKYQHSLIIDFANELGFVNWAGNTPVAQQAYVTAYDSAIHVMRRAGVLVPLMIDAPDCGESVDILGNVATGIVSSDPLHNVIFSTHVYWYGYANNDSATMLQDITNAWGHNFPLVFGEVSKYQDSVDNGGTTYYCHYIDNYTAILNIAKQQGIGWLAWSWDNDLCTARQISANGMYDSLSVLGMDIVNNPVYGIAATSKLTSYLKNGTCTSSNGIENISDQKPYLLYYDNDVAYIRSLSNGPLALNEYDMIGRLLQQTDLQPWQAIALSNTYMGIVQVTCVSRQYVSRFTSLAH
jgi:mannan endo-1,4-beta-mannosidase